MHIYEIENKNNDLVFKMQENHFQKKKIIIDFELKSLKGLFKNCSDLIELSIIKCNRKDIIDIREMFFDCKNLDKLNIANLKTDNVTDMGYLFSRCSKLENINVLNFNTNMQNNLKI